MGAARDGNAKFYSQNKIQWSDKPLKILGIWLTSDRTLLFDLNYEGIFVKIESLINLWEQRGLSLFGKVAIINTLIASQFVYKFQVLSDMPE